MASRRQTLNFVTADSGLLVPSVVDDPVNERADISYDIAPATTDGWVLTSEGGIVGWAPPSGGGSGGVDSIAKSGASQLTGDVTLSEGANVTLTQVGQDIAIAASTGGGGTGVLDSYVEFTSAVTVSATTEGGANTVVTAGAVTADGATEYCVEFYSPEVDVGAANSNTFIVLYDGSSSIGRLANYGTGAGGLSAGPCFVRRYLTPSNASHTFSVRAFRAATNGLVNAGAGGSGNYMPGYIRVSHG